MRIIDLVGQVFGRLTVIERAGSPNNNARWKCRCECGRFSIVYGMDLRRAKQVSCGCLQTERRFKHGMAQTRVYRVWMQMRERCSNPNHKSWANYGGRGIKVCDEWMESFESFIADMGQRPDGYWLERNNNNRGYSKDNCQWVTPRAQQNNKRTNRLLEIDGITKTFMEWSREYGVPWTTIRARIERYGFDPKSAVMSPRQQGRKFERKEPD